MLTIKEKLGSFFPDTRVFPKVHHSNNDASTVLEQNKFSKNVTSNKD